MKLGGVFIIAVIASLSLQAQTTVEEANGTIRATASSLHKAGEELVVSISVEITRDLSSNESLVLVPVVTDSLENRLELPSIYINSRKQQIIFMREMGKKEKDARSLQRKNGSRQSIHYLQSVPFEKWMNHATLSLIEKVAVVASPAKKPSLVSPVCIRNRYLSRNSYFSPHKWRG